MKTAHQLFIKNIESYKDNDHILLKGTVYSTDEAFSDQILWFKFPETYADYIKVSADPFLAGLLPIAMQRHYDICVAGVLSKRLLEGVEAIKDIFSTWFSDMKNISITADSHISERVHSQAVGSFFTGGVDSFYTVLDNMNFYDSEARITHLIYVRGFDIAMDKEALYSDVLINLEQIADALSLELLTVSTNLREITEPFVEWGTKQHGASLASVALSLSSFFKVIYVPSSIPYQRAIHSFPWGSHPLVDNLWSNESMRIIQNGNEANRMQKVLWQIKNSPIALKHLRLCWKNEGDAYNCGKCKKCLRTKLLLHAAGILDKCKSFDSSIDMDRVKRHASYDAKFLNRLEFYLETMESEGTNEEFQNDLTSLLTQVSRRSSSFRSLLKQLSRKISLR